MNKVVIALLAVVGIASAQRFFGRNNLGGGSRLSRPIVAPLAGGVGVGPNLNIPIVRNVVGYPLYNFVYTVADPVTGDQRRHAESRNKDRMEGSYSVTTPNGNIQTVFYQSDKKHGFRARLAYRPNSNRIFGDFARNNLDGGFGRNNLDGGFGRNNLDGGFGRSNLDGGFARNNFDDDFINNDFGDSLGNFVDASNNNVAVAPSPAKSITK